MILMLGEYLYLRDFWILLYMMNFLTIYVHAFYETPNCTLIIIIIIIIIGCW